MRRLCFGNSLAVLVAALACLPAMTQAAPQFSVSLSRDAATISHSDERIEYAVNVSNVAPAPPATLGVGTKLGCEGAQIPNGERQWFGAITPNPDNQNTYSFDFRWIRNGEPATGWVAGDVGSSYIVQPADAGKALQCLVKGTNLAGSGSFVAASQPVTVIDPQPAVTPPMPNDADNVDRRPALAGPLKAATEETSGAQWSAGEELRCTAPSAGWSGADIDEWKFEWLRDGEPAPGVTSSPSATSSRYALTATDVSAPAAPAVFQCIAIAVNAGGAAIVESADVSTNAPAPAFEGNGKPNFRPFLLPQHVPIIEAVDNTTTGPVTLELELPGGQETFVYRIKGDGWSCTSQPAAGAAHAKAICTRSNWLVPGHSYPALNVRVFPDPDAPDLAVAKATVSGGGAATAVAEDQFIFTPALAWDITAFDVKVAADPEQTVDYTRAGGHPVVAAASFYFTKKRNIFGSSSFQFEFTPIEHVKNVFVDAARGFVGNALTVAEPCPTVEEVVTQSCPAASAVGGILVLFSGDGATYATPIYSLAPEYGTPSQFAFFTPGGGAFTFVPRLRPDEGYAITFEAAPVPERTVVVGAEPTICGFGFKEFRSDEVDTGIQGHKKTICFGPSEPGANPVPLITNPTRCAGPPPAQGLRVSSWEHPENFATRSFSTPHITECENVDFEPEVELIPTNRQADSPTGLDVEFTMPTDGLFETEGVAQATLNNAIVTFPEGMTVNPSSADGLGACSLAQLKFKSNEPDECPESSRIGTVEIETPLIRETLTGSVYLAKQNENPFQSAFGLYMVFSSPRDGVTVKVAGKLVPDPITGQLVSSFAENPEWPFSRLELHFNSGPRAPLINPPACGEYAIRAELSPWSAVNPANPTPDEIIVDDSVYEVNSGPGGGPCPDNTLDPKLKAGIQNATAAEKSPFVFSLSREDGTQRFKGVDVANPQGLTAYVKGIPYCPESALASISGREETGRAELADPSCPAASQVGSVSAGSGAGPFPFYVDTGKIYLAGPYKGAPISLAAVTPAVAGPYDLGSVLVRIPLYVDPVTSQVVAKSDPIPTTLHGIVLDVRDIRVALDRPNFTAAPTSCEPRSVDATVTGEQGTVKTVSNRFQVGGCEYLGFNPRLYMRLFGGTKRGAHPKFRAILQPRPGDANIAAASVALPHSEFLDQAHIRTVCTRVQFAANQCPPGSIYGYAEATTPLLDHPVSGPAYLRSSSNQLPDLVMALRGPDSQPIEVHAVGRIDSVNGGIRSTFDVIPDQPVSSFTLTMQGGKKGLLVNSRDLCKGTPARATAVFTGQNGKTKVLRPELKNACGKQAKKQQRSKKRRER